MGDSVGGTRRRYEEPSARNQCVTDYGMHSQSWELQQGLLLSQVAEKAEPRQYARMFPGGTRLSPYSKIMVILMIHDRM